MTATGGMLIAYVIGVLVTFDLVGQRFDPDGPAIDVKLGCVITLAASALWPLTAGLVLAERMWRLRRSTPRSESVQQEI